MKNKPVYSVDSVDHALRLAVLLQQEGPFGVTDAAERIGVARSTAHRLLAMLVYRDFAVQDADRRYAAGPVLRPLTGVEPVTHLRAIATPHLHDLVDRTGETASLVVPLGRQVRFVLTVECGHVLRVRDREGRLLPAHLTSGGRALLARLRPAEVDARYADDADVDLPALHRALRHARRHGVAVNDQETEKGVTALGVAVEGPAGSPVAAVSVAMPTARYARTLLPGLAAALREAASAVERDLGSLVDGWPPPAEGAAVLGEIHGRREHR